MVALHPETAERFSIAEGEWVWVENREGRAKFKAIFQSEIDTRVVIVEHAWWFPEKFLSGLYDLRLERIQYQCFDKVRSPL